MTPRGMTTHEAAVWLLTHDCLLTNALRGGLELFYLGHKFTSANADKGMALIDVVQQAQAAEAIAAIAANEGEGEVKP